MIEHELDGELARAARRVLRDNDTGRWTRPSRTQYPHQWNWDSAFVSLGWATFDWKRAGIEVESMLGARWREGMVPHIRYDRRFVDDYFPGPDRWPRARAHVNRKDELTSGITNPPFLVSAALRIGRRQPDRERRRAFWQLVFPALREWIEYLGSRRQLPGSPLVAVVHPWETGWDNSTRWDHLAAAHLRPRRPYQRLDVRHVAATERPSDSDYDAYMALVELLDEADYDLAAYFRQTPFCVYDVLIDALWYGAARDLNEMAADLGEPPPFDPGRLREFAAAFEAAHWDPELGLYVDWDCVAGRRIRRPSAAGLAALAGGVVGPDRARRVWERYRELSGDALAVCTVPPSDPGFDPRRYWRGPVWLQINWLVAEGLAELGMAAEAAALRELSVTLVRSGEFAEYFDALTGEPCGSRSFSWSAALTLDLLASRRQWRSSLSA
jgi:hypothetical protein